MSRKSWVWDEDTKSLIPKEEWLAKQEPTGVSAMIMPDIPDFVSPIDQRVVHGRRGLRDHNKQHGVTNVADYKNTWNENAKQRAKAFTPGSSYDSSRRKEHIARSIEQLRRR